MGKTLFIQNSFENPWMNYGIPGCRYGSGEVKCGDVYEKKMHIVSLYHDYQPITCATTFTHIWEKGVVI